MKNTLRTSCFRVAILLALTLLVIGNVNAEETKEKSKKGVVRVEPKKVCMVNDRVFEKDQIPVEFEGRIYYGCCKMCEKALKEKEEFRNAVDPVSGKKVDKAKAVIGVLADGTTLYFESKENLSTFNKGKKE